MAFLTPHLPNAASGSGIYPGGSAKEAFWRNDPHPCKIRRYRGDTMGFFDPARLTVELVKAADEETLINRERRSLWWIRLLKHSLGTALLFYVLVCTWAIVQLAGVVGLLGYLVFTFWQNGEPMLGWNAWLLNAGLIVGLALLFAALMLLAGAGLFGLFDRVRQLISDKQARIAFIKIVKGKPEVFTLYLRAFDTTEQVRFAPKRSFVWRMLQVAKFVLYSVFIGPFSGAEGRERAFVRMFVDRRSQSELEQAIWDDYRLGTPLLALGNSDGKFGAGKIATTDANWKETAALLVEKSRAIICLPDDNAGTLWELGLLRQTGAISKTIFVMPSAQAVPERAKTFEVEWNHMVTLAAQQGLLFPSFRPEGMFFAPAIGETPPYEAPFNFRREGTFRRLFADLSQSRETPEEKEALATDRRRRRRR